MAAGGARKGAGRKKGTPNKLTADVKNMILSALDKAGGVDYLYKQSLDNPTAFMTLIGKVLPLQIGNAEGETFKTESITDDKDKEIIARFLNGRK